MRTNGFRAFLERAQGGDPTALDALLAELQLDLCRAAEALPRETACESLSDVLQETSLRLWKALPQFHGVADDVECAAMFSEWATQILRTVNHDLWRARHAQRRTPSNRVLSLGTGPSTDDDLVPSDEPVADQPAASALFRRDERDAIIRTALAGIADPQAREILHLRFFEALSLRQIAVRMGLGYDKVRTLFSRTMHDLETKLEGLL